MGSDLGDLIPKAQYANSILGPKNIYQEIFGHMQRDNSLTNLLYLHYLKLKSLKKKLGI